MEKWAQRLAWWVVILFVILIGSLITWGIAEVWAKIF